MTMPARIRRIGWLAALSICAVLYTLLHLKVNALHAEVVQAERQIVRLEEQNLLLETEFLTRSNHLQLAKINRINFGYRAPEAAQFIHGERQLARFGGPRSLTAPAPIRLAGMGAPEDLPPFPDLVAPLSGRPVPVALVAQQPAAPGPLARITLSAPEPTRRVAIAGLAPDGAP